MKTFFELREAIKSADKKPENYVGPDGKTKVRMVPADKNVAEALKVDTKIRMAAAKMKRKMEKEGKTPAQIAKAIEVNFPSLSESVELDEVSNAVKDQLGNIDLSIRDWEKRWKNKSAGNPNDMKAPQKIKDLKAQKAALMKKHNIKEEVELDEGKKGVVLGFKDQYKSRAGATDDGQRQMKKLGGSSFTVYQSSNGLWAYKIFEGVEDLDEAGPKIKPDFLKVQRAKDAAHNAAMGRTATGRKKPVRTMTSTQRSMASMNKEEVEIDEVTVANSTAAFDLKKKAESYKKTMIASQQAKGQAAHDKFLKARTAFTNALKKLNQMDLPKAELDALKKGTNIRESVELDEGISNLSHSRLKYHATKGIPHGSHSNAEIKDEHKRRLRSEPDYVKAKASMNEGINEISQKAKDDYVKKSQGSHSQMSAIARDSGTPDDEKARLRKKMKDRNQGMTRAMEEAKPDATEVIRKKKQMAAISTSDKDKLSKIAQMMKNANK